jgi:hypothetical protein
MAASVEASSASSSVDTWMTQWQQESLQTPCGSCTGRACTICSIRVGGSTKADGTPSGYAPKILEYYNTASGLPADIAPLVIDLTPNAIRDVAVRRHHGNSILQGCRRCRRAYRLAVDEQRYATGHCHLHQRNLQRLANSHIQQSGHGDGWHHLSGQLSQQRS